MTKSRKIFFVMAGGGHEADRHYYDTIKNRRSVAEFGKYLTRDEAAKLTDYSHGRPYAVWGAAPGPSNIRNWETMEEGDYVLVYRRGKIILAAEVAMKVRNPELAKFFWQVDDDGKTWEFIYFMINDAPFDLEIGKLNKYLGYEETYHPQGFMAIKQEKVDQLLSTYGDLISLLNKLSGGQKLEEIEYKNKQLIEAATEQQIERAPTEHTEMQWRLIRLGLRSHFDVWVPEADKNRDWKGEIFRPLVLEDFHETLDVPAYIKNIDTVWKLGQSVKAAFEVENSTAVYSGILRLSDLRALTPNSNYPLFIVAPRERRRKVFNELQRPTFSNPYLGLDRAVKYLSYDVVRELDETVKENANTFDIDWLQKRAEEISAST